MATTDNKTPVNASNVYLFKNGYGMIVKTFEFPANTGNESKPVEIIDPPSNPVHGTFWIQSLSNNTSISSIRAKKTDKFVEKECLTIEDLLDGNIGEDVQLLVTDCTSTSKEWISGKVKSVKRAQQDCEDGEKNVNRNLNLDVRSTFHYSPVIQSSVLVLFETTDNGLLALPVSSVHSIRGPTLKTTYQRKISTNCLSIDYKNNSGSSEVGLMKYLTYGITWAPSYNLVLLSPTYSSGKRLRLSSKAVILNDIENMNVDNLFCIVGFPNISKFASVVDPIISGENVNEFLSRLQQCEVESGREGHFNRPSAVMTQQMVMPISSSMNNYIPNDTPQDANVDDLHLYEFKNVLLQKKERLMLPIFDVEIPYKDIYHCKIDVPQPEHIHSGYAEKKPYEDVWHSVEFDNISNFVWTTAPILITKGQEEQQFIGQDTLTYTLKGSTTFVNLTKALDVRVQCDETGLAKQKPTHIVLVHTKYQTDEINGKISVMNYKSEEVTVVISITLMGQVKNYSIAPKKDEIKANAHVANEKHEIQWEVNVKPKQTIEVKYTRLYNMRI